MPGRAGGPGLVAQTLLKPIELEETVADQDRQERLSPRFCNDSATRLPGMNNITTHRTAREHILKSNVVLVTGAL